MATLFSGSGRPTTESTGDWRKTLAQTLSSQRPSSPPQTAVLTVIPGSLRRILPWWAGQPHPRPRPNPPGPTRVSGAAQRVSCLHPISPGTGKTCYSLGTGQPSSSTCGATTTGTTPTSLATGRSWRPRGPICSRGHAPSTSAPGAGHRGWG